MAAFIDPKFNLIYDRLQMVSPLRAHPSITGCDLPCVFHPYTLIGRRNFTDLLVLYDRLGSVGYKFCFLRELISCFHRFFVTMCEKWGGGGNRDSSMVMK